jgi:L-threonylcarbamoyladenylate synthase
MRRVLPFGWMRPASRTGEALIAFGPAPIVRSKHRPHRSQPQPETGDLAEAAANLFDYMKRADASGAATIAFTAIPDEGLGEAINDRLRRAAAPRE